MTTNVHYIARPRIFSHQSQCDGKVKHANIHHATMAHCNSKDPENLMVYRCPHCRFWHLGTEMTRTQLRLAPKRFEVVVLPKKKVMSHA